MEPPAIGRSLVVVVMAAAVGDGCDRPPECPDVHFEQAIQVPATSAALVASPVFSAELTAGPPGTALSITNNLGTFAFEGRGPVPAFIYAQIPYGAADSTLYAGLGIDDGAWYPFWLYCSDDGRLTAIDAEMTDRDLGVLEPVQGTCTAIDEIMVIPLNIPAHTLRNVALTCGFSASTAGSMLPAVELAGSRAGTIDLPGASLTVLPFHGVDCRESCGSPGWYEVHALVWNPSAPSVGFGVFYLDQMGLSLSDGFSLPAASPLGIELPGATWTLSR